jgi:general secretion pathway protein E
MFASSVHEFAAHFCQRAGLRAEIDKLGGRSGESGLRKLWEMSELSAAEFADEVARFYQLPRVTRQELIVAEPKVQQFSRRFLREMAIFPISPPPASRSLRSPIPATARRSRRPVLSWAQRP